MKDDDSQTFCTVVAGGNGTGVMLEVDIDVVDDVVVDVDVVDVNVVDDDVVGSDGAGGGCSSGRLDFRIFGVVVIFVAPLDVGVVGVDVDVDAVVVVDCVGFQRITSPSSSSSMTAFVSAVVVVDDDVDTVDVDDDDEDACCCRISITSVVGIIAVSLVVVDDVSLGIGVATSLLSFDVVVDDGVGCALDSSIV
jgi:hypothetical protein